MSLKPERIPEFVIQGFQPTPGFRTSVSRQRYSRAQPQLTTLPNFPKLANRNFSQLSTNPAHKDSLQSPLNQPLCFKQTTQLHLLGQAHVADLYSRILRPPSEKTKKKRKIPSALPFAANHCSCAQMATKRERAYQLRKRR